MGETNLDRELRDFAVELIERCGGLAEWSPDSTQGSAVVPADLALVARLPGEEFALTREAGPKSLQVGLGGEFLEVCSSILNFAVPRAGAFCIPDRYLTRRDLSEKIRAQFVWQNARAKYRDAEPRLVEYHLWTMHGSLRSEDVWETAFRIAVNSESQALVELPDLFQEPDLRGGQTAAELTHGESFETAAWAARRLLISGSAEFIRRLESRLERDRQRLQDYYRALAREAAGGKRRTATPLTAEEIAAKKRTVDVELRRKLIELDETYAVKAGIRPVFLARINLPCLVVPITIQRKQAIREYRLYWNSVVRKLEPLACVRCHAPTYSATFTNDTVELLCTQCAQEEC